MSARRPAILAHRGGAGEAPENTLSAVAHAVACGADGAELDLRLTADGVPVVCHDADLVRLADDPRRVAAATAAELGALELRAFAGSAGAPLRIPTLEQALAAARVLAWLDLDLKSDGDAPGRMASAVAGALVRAGRGPGATVVTSFDPEAVAALARLCPELPCGLVLEAPPADDRWTRHRAVALELGLARAGWAEEARRRGLAVLVWAVEAPGQLAAVARLGVDAAITDHPARLLAADPAPAAGRSAGPHSQSGKFRL